MAKENMPEWAKRLENWGKRMEARYGNKSEKSCYSEQSEESRPGSFAGAQDDKNKTQTYGTYRRWKRQNPIGDMFGQLVSYLIFTYIPPYFPGFFLSGWSAVYTVIVFSILIHVAVDLLLIILTAKPFYYLGQVVTNIAGIVSMIVMVTIFPFNFPETVGNIIQFVLWFVIAILAIVTVFDFLKIFSPDWEK